METGRGEGGDMALVIDRAAEDAIFAELEALGVPLTAVSEERGEVAIAGGGPVRVVIDPVDGSLNAKRGAAVRVRLDRGGVGPRMADVEVGYVAATLEARPRARLVGGARRGRLPGGRAPAARSSLARSRCSAWRRPARRWSPRRRAAHRPT